MDSKCPYDDKGRPSVDAVVLVFDVLLFDFETKPRERRNALLVLKKDTSSANSIRLYLWHAALLTLVSTRIALHEHEHHAQDLT